MTNDTWTEWSRHVLAELKRLSDNYDKLAEKLDERFNELAIELAKLKVKASVWGAIGGAIPVLLGLLVWWIKSGRP